MSSIYVSAIGYVHGDPRSSAELTEKSPVDLSPLIAEIGTYRRSNREVRELAVTAGERTLAISPDVPDLIVYVTENDPDSTASLARIADHLGLSTVDYLTVSGHDCGNFGPALQVARDAILSGRCVRVLLLLADRALTGHRTMANGMSVLSDGAAACLVTREAPEVDGPRFEVDAVITRTRVQLDSADTADRGILSTVQLAMDSMAGLLEHTGRSRADFRHVVFGNYRVTSQKFLTTAIRFPPDALLSGAVADLGHCFSADVLVTLDQHRRQGTIAAGDRLLASATGPHSWSTVSFACL